jgi:hypothetical protein
VVSVLLTTVLFSACKDYLEMDFNTKTRSHQEELKQNCETCFSVSTLIQIPALLLCVLVPLC